MKKSNKARTYKGADSWNGKKLVSNAAGNPVSHVLEDYGNKVMLMLQNGLCIVLSKEAALMTSDLRDTE